MIQFRKIFIMQKYLKEITIPDILLSHIRESKNGNHARQVYDFSKFYQFNKNVILFPVIK